MVVDRSVEAKMEDFRTYLTRREYRKDRLLALREIGECGTEYMLPSFARHVGCDICCLRQTEVEQGEKEMT